MDQKPFVLEYILTNGALPGFKERLETSKESWKTVTTPFTVYRGQGHTKPGIPVPPNTVKNNIKNSVRPVISTTKNITNALQFTDQQGCCIFEITVQPGIRYLDFTEFPDFTENDVKEFMAMKEEKEKETEYEIWPYNYISPPILVKIANDRKNKETEVLLDGNQGTFKHMGEGLPKTFELITNETKRKKVKEYKKIQMRIIKKSYEPKSGGATTQKKSKTRKRAHRKSQRSKTIQQKSL
jgi:hypothetical protein